jgi:hypothetical protein
MSEHDPDMSAFEAAQERDVEESAGVVGDLLEEVAEAISTEQTDWHDECAEYGCDPNCYGAGFHAGLIQGLETVESMIRARLTPARDAATETRNG